VFISSQPIDPTRTVLQAVGSRPGGLRIYRVANGKDDDVEVVADQLVVEIERLAAEVFPVGNTSPVLHNPPAPEGDKNGYSPVRSCVARENGGGTAQIEEAG